MAAMFRTWAHIARLGGSGMCIPARLQLRLPSPQDGTPAGRALPTPGRRPPRVCFGPPRSHSLQRRAQTRPQSGRGALRGRRGASAAPGSRACCICVSGRGYRAAGFRPNTDLAMESTLCPALGRIIELLASWREASSRASRRLPYDHFTKGAIPRIYTTICNNWPSQLTSHSVAPGTGRCTSSFEPAAQE
eukprot:358829-Chlamydomonas_euryale.AAC.2